MPTLSTLLARVRALLMDDDAQVWTDAALTEAVRMALGEYSLAAQSAAALQDLDGAPATTFPPEHETALVWGAAAYAALARAVDRAESFQLGSQFQDLKDWGEARLREFKRILGALFPTYLAVTSETGASSAPDPAEAARLAGLRGSTNPAWGVWQEDI